MPLRLNAIVTGDLRSGAETRGVAEQVNAIGHMDAVIHNAGIYTVPDRGWTREGHAHGGCQSIPVTRQPRY